jgi:hypothetical protein
MEETHESFQAAYLDGDPAASAHLATCDVCGPERPALDELRSLLDDEASWVEPAADLGDRVVAAAHEARPPVTPVAPVAPVVSLDDRRPPRRWRTVGLVAAACVLAAAVGGGVVAWLGRAPGADYQVALAATELAPADATASGEVRDTPSGFKITLDVRGLPRTTDGHYYEAWLKDDEGTLVPIGTFHTGAGEIVLWSGVPVDEYSTLTVTLEAADGDQASSGQVVLLGSITD